MEVDQEVIDLQLMNAHVAVESNQAQDALDFLEKVDISKLTARSEAVYQDIYGQAKVLLKDYEAGISALLEALRLLESDPNSSSLQTEQVRNWIGIAYYEQGDISQALEQHRRCLRAILDRRIEAARFRLKLFLNLGNDYLLLGYKEKALDYYRQAMNEAEKGEDQQDLAGIYWAMGLAYRSSANLGRAKLYFDKSARQFEDIGEIGQAARVRNLLGLVLVERKEYGVAEKTLKEAFATATTLKKPDLVTLCSASTNLALSYLQQEKWSEAEEWGVRSLDYAEKLENDALHLSQVQAQLAEIKLAMGKNQEAIDLFEQAVANIDRSGVVEITRQIYFRYGNALKQLGRLEEAYEMLSKSYLLLV